MEGTGKVKKYEVALFLKTGKAVNYTRIKKATDLKIEFNADVHEYDYIADVSPTSELEKYKPQITGLPLTMYREEPDFAMLWDLAYGLKVGGEAVGEMLLVYKFDEDAETTGQWKAWSAPATIIIKTLDAVEGKLEFDVQPRGTITQGTVTESGGNPTFQPAA